MEKSIICPIPEPAPACNFKDPINFQIINLISSLSQIIERVIRLQINILIQEHKIIPPDQLGSRA